MLFRRRYFPLLSPANLETSHAHLHSIKRHICVLELSVGEEKAFTLRLCVGFYDYVQYWRASPGRGGRSPLRSYLLALDPAR